MLVHRQDIDSLVAAAWIHDVFITIHPFEVGLRVSLLLQYPRFDLGSGWKWTVGSAPFLDSAV